MKRNVFTVNQITRYIKRLFDEDVLISDVYVSGEIANLKFHQTGHVYFTLKDDAAINCVMFASCSADLGFLPKNGQQVVCYGRVGVYEKTGNYSLYVEDMELTEKPVVSAFELLKQKLAAEGLFDTAHKRPLPARAKTVGIITSESGAVIHDIIQVSRRRNPSIKLVLFPVTVQGETAAVEISDAVKLANESRFKLDAVIVGRGGGSAEDLAAFNDERVVRAVYASRLPVITAVGHETDFCLADFASDRRAATPSEAAELICWDIGVLRDELFSMRKGLENKLDARFSSMKHTFTSNLDRLNSSISLSVSREKRNLASAIGILERVSPLAVMRRGFLAAEIDEKPLKSVNDAKTGDEMTVTLIDGKITASVTDTIKFEV